MPMAISFVGALGQSGVLRLLQCGGANAIVVAFGGEPGVGTSPRRLQQFFLMAILIWIQTPHPAAARGIRWRRFEAAIILDCVVQVFWN